ncbi:MAG: PAS domain S-box protein [Candidatus Bathyarchaeia archaeon]|jgi:PAS domain S-box-containing protein
MKQSPVELSKEGTLETAKAPAVRVLHVDDDACFLKTAKAILEMQGTFQVDTASCIEEAWEKMRKEEYDTVVSDYQMPGKNGLQFLKELREKGNSIPFIIFTGKGREEVAIKALNLGADGYFNKSGHAETVYGELAHGIRQIVDKRRLEQSFLKSEDKYRRLVETLHEGIWVIDKDSRTTFVNPRMAEILGYDIEEMKGRHLFSFMDEREVEIAKRLLERRKQGIKEQHDFEFLRKDGTRVYVTLETSPITDDNRNYIGALASVMDTTERKKAEEDLRNSEERWRSLAEGSPDHIMLLDLKFNILYINRTVPDLKREEVIGTSTFNYIPPEWHRVAKDCFKRVIATGKTDHHDTEYRTKDGEVRYFDVRIGPVFQEDRVVALISSSTDVTSQKKAEVELRNTKNYLDNLLNYANAPIIVWDNAKRITLFNNAFEVLTGRKKESVLGRNIDILFPPLQKEEILQTIEGATKGEKWKSVEIPILCKDKETKIALWNSANITDEEGKIVATIAQGQDITERKRVEDALKQSKENFESLAENAFDGLLVGTQGGVHAYANKRAAEITGYTVAELLRTTIKELVHPDESEKILERYRRRIEGRAVPNPCETVIIAKDGRSVPIEIAGARTIWERNPADLVFFRDITERKKMENTLRENERKYRVLVENIPQKIFIKDKNSVYVSCNENYARDLKIKSNEIMGKTDYDFYTEELAEKYRADDKRIMESEETQDIEEEYIQNGQKVYVHTAKTPVKDENDNVIGVLGIFGDITERKKAKVALQESEERFRAIVESAPFGYYRVGKDGLWQYVNPVWERMHGLSLAEVVGKSFEITQTEDSVEQAKEYAKRALAGETIVGEFSRLTGEGDIEYHSFNIQPVKRDNEIVAIEGFINDISERKKALERLRVLNEKLEVVGKLTRHDVRNKLSVVTGNAYLAKKALPNDHQALSYIKRIESACEQSTRILDFAAIYEILGVEEPHVVEVGKAVEEAVSLATDLHGVKVVNECRGLVVLADSLLKQLFYNLIDDSLRHGEKVSRIRLHYKEGKSGLKLFYEDDGVGIAYDEKPKIFKGYSKTRTTGYGLTLIRRMMEVYGWTIEEKGVPGKGAQFVITIPTRADSNPKQRHSNKKAFY